MTLRKYAERCGLTIANSGASLDMEPQSGYAGDLMSDVLAHAEAGAVWLTIQVHSNVVAVAAARDLACVVFTGGNVPSEDTRRLAAEEGVTVLLSGRDTFETALALGAAGLRGIGHEGI